jgi:methyl-accepting chemotaxis protein
MRIRELRWKVLIKSIGAKIFLGFMTSILFFVLSIGFISYTISKGIIHKKVADASEQTIVQTGKNLDLLYANFDELTMQMTLDEDISSNIFGLRKLNRGSLDYKVMNRELSDKLDNYVLSSKMIQTLYLFNEQGELISSSSQSSVNQNQSKEDWFQEIKAADGKSVWLPTREAGFTGSGASNTTFAVGRLLMNQSTGQVTGILLMEIKFSTLSQALEEIDMGDGGFTTIVSGNHKVVYSGDKAQLGKEAVLDVADDAFIDNKGKLMSRSGIYQMVYYKSKVNSWNVIGSMPVNQLVKDANLIYRMTWMMAGLAAVIALVMGIFFAGRIGRPIVLLRNLMNEGEKGNLLVRMTVKSEDEIGQLGKSFNQMMEKIMGLVQQTNVSAFEVQQTAVAVADASKKTAAAANDIAMVTEEIAEGASMLAVESERGSDLTYGISTQVKRVVESNSTMEMIADKVQNSCRLGIDNMRGLIDKTNSTELITRSMVEKVGNLRDNTHSIHKILDLLGDITQETNVLSLNATIEAARAGTAGKGFMVVADEIRKLAEKSRQSIQSVGKMTETIQTEMDQTASTMSEALPVFQEQMTAVKHTDTIFKQVDYEMSGFIEQISDVTLSIRQLEASQRVLMDSMTSVSAVAEQSSATTQEVASTSAEQLNVAKELVNLSDKLEQLSQSLKDSMAKFQIESPETA